MIERVYRAYRSKEQAELRLSMYPIDDRDCHVRMYQMPEADAQRIYNQPEIWVVSGEYYK